MIDKMPFIINQFALGVDQMPFFIDQTPLIIYRLAAIIDALPLIIDSLILAIYQVTVLVNCVAFIVETLTLFIKQLPILIITSRRSIRRNLTSPGATGLRFFTHTAQAGSIFRNIRHIHHPQTIEI